MRAVLCGLLGAVLSFGALRHIYVDQRVDVEKAKPFGAAGPYERITASAVYEPAMKIDMVYLKPTNPAKGNGGLVLLTGKSLNPETLMRQGYTILQLKTGDAAAIREMVGFLRYGGGPDAFLLGDQKRFLKRAILVGDAAALKSILFANQDAKNRKIFDAAVVTGGKDSFQAPGGVMVGKSIADVEAQPGNPAK